MSDMNSLLIYKMRHNCLNTLKPKKEGITNPQNYNFSQFLNTENVDALKRYESTEVDRRVLPINVIENVQGEREGLL